MKYRTLINFIGKYNHYNMLAALNLKPETVVYIRMEEDYEAYDNTKTCIEERLPDTKYIEHVIKEQDFDLISEIIAKYDGEDTILNLSGGSKLIGLLALQAAQRLRLTPVYIDNDRGHILKFKDKVEVLAPLDIDLTVEDIVCSTGAEILHHSTKMYDKQEIKDIVSYMIDNYESWNLVKIILRSSSLIKQFDADPLLIQISSSRLSNQQQSALKDFLKELSEKKLISSYAVYKDYIEFTFASKEAKSFIMTAGCWLEAITYRCIKELSQVDNAISGMHFVWDEEVKVHNELDVVAAVDSHLVCVSCKDTEKYDVEDLNELEVYAEHLGGRRVIKILVSTQKPERGEMILQRAREMGIYIVLFDGNLRSFKDKLNHILMK